MDLEARDRIEESTIEFCLKMAKQQAIEQLKALQSSDDPKNACSFSRIHMASNAHAQADEVICRLLTILGFHDVVEEFQKIDRWFA